jgi:hypothetical protein
MTKIYLFFKTQPILEKELISRSEDKFAISRRQEHLEREGKPLPPFLTPISCDDLKDDEIDCVICSDRLGEQEKPVATPCGYLFGNLCIHT